MVDIFNGELDHFQSLNTEPVKSSQQFPVKKELPEPENMVKRPSRGPSGPPDSRKRQKVAREPPSSEDVTNSRQLKKLLEFRQDVRDARHGMCSPRHSLTH
ncbi:hypothetical protein IMZ48_27730 [Candidatus Bathyarchaeota archaeon]|nr:hypothetical protein [Candidatus Bathyarchaeota archaeon]